MIFHDNCLLADDSHEISCLICYFSKWGKIWNCHLLQIVGGASRVNYPGTWKSHIFINTFRLFTLLSLGFLKYKNCNPGLPIVGVISTIFGRSFAFLYLYKQSFSGEWPRSRGPSCFFLLACCMSFRNLIMHNTTIYRGWGHHFNAAGL